jgi:hypothetical protein
VNRIFGIGLTRTGTTSLAEALQLAGIPAAHWIRESHFEQALERYRAIVDMPVTIRYRELDARFPGSRFILTLRELDGWLDSCRRWFLTHPPRGLVARYRIALYGTPHFEPERMTQVYHRHHAEVEEYFRGREKDLLRLNICAGEGWERLLPFLGLGPVGDPFPHSNRSSRS